MNAPAYRLDHNVDHIDYPRTPGQDADLVEGPEWDNAKSMFWKPEPIQTQTPLVFSDGMDVILQTTDYPYVAPTIPVMSKRMLEALLSVGDFPHQAIPVVIKSRLSSNLVYDNFVAVQLLEHLDVFDWDNSVYEMNSVLPEYIGNVDRLVLKEPSEGLPPIFRIQDYETLLYVSARARAALEQADIKGVEFRNLTY
jgi:hypothetical protein